MFKFGGRSISFSSITVQSDRTYICSEKIKIKTSATKFSRSLPNYARLNVLIYTTNPYRFSPSRLFSYLFCRTCYNQIYSPCTRGLNEELYFS